MSYESLFLWLAIAAVLPFAMPHYTNEHGFRQRQINRTYAILVFLPVVYFVVYAPQKYWGDYFAYMRMFREMPIELEEIGDYIAAQKNSQLFYLTSIAVKALVSKKQLVYQILLTILQTLPIAIFFWRYSDNFMFSAFLFLATSVPLAWMLNGVRQFCAVVILYTAAPLIVEKKNIRLILVVLIAALFHESAIFMLPIVLACQGKAWNKKTLLFMLAAAVMTIYIANTVGASDEFLESAGYSAEVYAKDDGVHPLRVAVSAAPVVLAWMFRKRVAAEDSPIINVAINMSIIGFAINMVGMVTSGILVGRIPIYMSMYNFVLIPYLLRRAFAKNSYPIMVVLVGALYGLYYFVQR